VGSREKLAFVKAIFSGEMTTLNQHLKVALEVGGGGEGSGAGGGAGGNGQKGQKFAIFWCQEVAEKAANKIEHPHSEGELRKRPKKERDTRFKGGGPN